MPASFFSGADSGSSAADIISALQLEPFPAGGHARETHRSAAQSIMLVLLEVGDVFPWHRYQGGQSWFWHAGGPLALTVSPDGHDASALHLGNHIEAGQRPQASIEVGQWMTAESLGHWTLMGWSCVPGFTANLFEQAAPDWFPKPRPPAA